MNWLLICLLAFCVLCIYNGARKGFVRMAVSMVFLILVCILSAVLNPYVSSFIKENTGLYRVFTENCSDMIEERLEESSSELTLNAQVQAIDSLPLPQTVKDGLLKNNTADTYRRLAVEEFADYIAAYLGNLLVSAVAFLVSFILALLLLKIILGLTDLLTALPVISQINFAGGAILGFISAMIWIGLFFLLAGLLHNTAFGQLVQEALQESTVVHWFYDYNILWLLIEVLLGL